MGNHKNRVLGTYTPPETLPALTLLLPCCNCSEKVARTLASIAQQDYSPLEVIVLDAMSTDRTHEIVHEYGALVQRVYTVSTYHLPEMINRGIALAQGVYITVLMAGATFIASTALKQMGNAVLAHRGPQLFYTGALYREMGRDPHSVYAPFERSLLAEGKNFASLGGCWIRADVFEELGRFSSRYEERMLLEFFCRLASAPALSVASLDRVLVDYDYVHFTYKKGWRAAWETWDILRHYFGVRSSLRWLCTLDHKKLLHLLWIRTRSKFLQQ